MSFGRPDLLWLLFGAVPIVVLYLVRRRRRKVAVPSLLLWERVLAREPRRFGAGILSALLSLLLMLLTLAAAVLAAADPGRGAPSPPARPLLICVAASARMQGERWERAVDLVRAELMRKAPGDAVTLFLVSDAPRIAVVGEADPGAVLAGLARFEPGLAREGWDLVRPAVEDALFRGMRVVAVGVRPDVPEGVALHPVGGANSGITAFGAEARADTVEVFLDTTGAEGAEVVITLDDDVLMRGPAEPGSQFTLARGSGGLLRASLSPGSGPGFDDSVEAFVPAPPSLRVALVLEGEPDPFLTAALEVAGPLLDAERSSRVAPSVLDRVAADYDVLILAADVPPESLPPGRWILLCPPVPFLGHTPAPLAESSPIWRRALDHPVTMAVDAAEVQVVGAEPALIPAGTTALLGLPGGVVAAAGRQGGVRYVWIGLGPRNSTLPVTGAYPLLIRNSLSWFASLESAPLRTSYRLGEAISPAVRLPAGLAAVAASGPGEGDGEVVAVDDGRFAYRPASRSEGEVLVRVGEGEHRTRVNALLPGESSVEPLTGEPEFGEDRSGHTDTRERLWPWLAAAAALFLLLEWVHYRFTRG